MAKAPSISKRRTQIWDLHNSLHCSIIGTCLSTGELRQLLVRLKVPGAESAEEHDLHKLGVFLAAGPKTGAKHLQKALDRRHRISLNQFAKAKDAAAASALWDDALARGDIPGAYWALLTHPAATDAMVKQAFGKVHMLSHLVGAANRADIHRLRQLEDDNAALAAKLDRQQKQLRDGFINRDETIRRLNDMLVKAAGQEAAARLPAAAEDVNALKSALAELDKRLAHETSRRKRLEQRLETVTSTALSHAERARQRAERELASIEPQLGALLVDYGQRPLGWARSPWPDGSLCRRPRQPGAAAERPGGKHERALPASRRWPRAQRRAAAGSRQPGPTSPRFRWTASATMR